MLAGFKATDIKASKAMERQNTRFLWMFGAKTPTSPLLLFPKGSLEDFGLNRQSDHNPLKHLGLISLVWFELLALNTVEQTTLFNLQY